MSDELLQEQSVQATMIIPLYGRARMSELYPDLIYDSEAVRIVSELNMDFTEIEKAFGEYGGASYLSRMKCTDEEVNEFLKKYPDSTVVNIGSGLDTTFSRTDNGRVLWYNLDLPDAVIFRQKFISQTQRCTDIPKSVFDFSWLDDITLGRDGQILLIAAGVLMYLESEMLCTMINKVIEKFPQGELFFDAASGIGYKLSDRMVRKSGNKGAQMHFYVNGTKPLYAWSPKIVSAEILPFFGNVRHIRKWSAGTRIQMKLCDLLGMGKYVRIRWHT